MKVTCSENAKIPCDIQLYMHEDGNLSIEFPFEFLDFGEDYYAQNGQNIFYSNVFDLLNECEKSAATEEDKMELMTTIKNLIKSCEKIKEKLEG